MLINVGQAAMADSALEKDQGALRLDFDRHVMLQFRGSVKRGNRLPIGLKTPNRRS